jgi:2Fe-2S ferredoxin
MSVITLTFVEHDGTEHTVSAAENQSLMQAAVDNCVPGIDADCGGGCACGTCHVKIPAPLEQSLASMAADEEHMLRLTPERDASSRLACQIEVTRELDGAVVFLPEFQM